MSTRKPKRQRADQLVVACGLTASRSEAQKAILAGRVRVGADHVVRNAAELLPEDADLQLTEVQRFVSRGADKLEPALRRYCPDLSGWVALDVGASTGGFTDLMLQQGAARVYAVDVGRGQLHGRLREDRRVVCLERTNARYLTAAQVPEPIDLLTVDVSFISLTKILPACAPLLRPGAWVLLLIKPQFEAGRSEVGKGGVVRSPAVRQAVVEDICEFAVASFAWQYVAAEAAPITGPKGNQEYVAVFRAAAQSFFASGLPGAGREAY